MSTPIPKTIFYPLNSPEPVVATFTTFHVDNIRFPFCGYYNIYNLNVYNARTLSKVFDQDFVKFKVIAHPSLPA